MAQGPEAAVPRADTRRAGAISGGGRAGSGCDYASLAGRLLDNGYVPLPIRPGSKRPATTRWTSVVVDPAQVATWQQQFPDCGIGLRTGALVGIDIDLLDADLAHEVCHRALVRFGDTLIRVGQWPKRLLLYRTDTPRPKLAVPGVEILGAGQQFVAFGRHPVTDRNYQWITGESPCEIALEDLPAVGQDRLAAFLAEVSALVSRLVVEPRQAGSCRVSGQGAAITRDEAGRVVDGRDGWLSRIAFHAVHDRLDRKQPLDPQLLAEIVWQRFCATADVARPRAGRAGTWSPQDAWGKVADKLRLLQCGRLPERPSGDLPPPEHEEAGLEVTEARAALDGAIGVALDRITSWYRDGGKAPAPATGIRATVGLGKSTQCRSRIAAWQKAQRLAGLPFRVLVTTPSHALAEETARAWRAAGSDAVVLRGYRATDPQTREPMCRDLPMVDLAIEARQGVNGAVCRRSEQLKCRYFDDCRKQHNRQDVARADVVVAPYDVLFTGTDAGSDPFALIVVDEGCWPRAVVDIKGPTAEDLARFTVAIIPTTEDCSRRAAALVDLRSLCRRVGTALAECRPGPVTRAALRAGDITQAECRDSARLLRGCLLDPGLRPGMSADERRQAGSIVAANERMRRIALVLDGLADLIAGRCGEHALRIAHVEGNEGPTIILHGHQRLNAALGQLPVLHLDATMRRELAKVILPGLEVVEIAAAQPHAHVTLVTGGFGKSSLCVGKHTAPEAAARRTNRLQECVDFVRWHALRLAPRPVLVITYRDIEAAFRGINGVSTAHFNAIAGLDRYRDAAAVILIGRPLPSDQALGPLVAGLFGRFPEGSYQRRMKSVRLRSGALAGIPVLEHEDEQAECLRAAICDDELIQAIGRGRGVNRTAETPLEIHVLANVALPLIHDQVIPWEACSPDTVQRMLIQGVAVDSPSDAAVLHPTLFGSAAAAESAFRRAGFNRQTPIYVSYRGLTVKSAGYRRGGRGRGWQQAFWHGPDDQAIRDRLEAALGPFAEWKPDLLRVGPCQVLSENGI